VINNSESTSLLPSPEESTTCTRESRVDDASLTPLVHTQVEGKGREGKRKGNKEGAIVTRPDFVDEQLWNDWIVIRKKKNAPLTETAWDLMTKEASKAGWPIEKAIQECCLRNWQSFKAEWVADKQNQTETVYQRSMRLKMQEAVPSIAKQAPYQDASDFFRTIDMDSQKVIEVNK
jgi:hypothetical protein